MSWVLPFFLHRESPATANAREKLRCVQAEDTAINELHARIAQMLRDSGLIADRSDQLQHH